MGGTTVTMLVCLMMVYEYLCQSEESNVVYIKRSIHKNESLHFDIEELFPTLVKDVKIQRDNWDIQKVMDGMKNETEYFLRNSSQMEVSNMFLEEFSSVERDSLDCSKMEEISYSYFYAICEDDTIFRVYHVDFEEKKISLKNTIKVVERVESSEFKIESVFSVPDEMCIYMLLSNGKEKKDMIIMREVIWNDLPNYNGTCNPTRVDFKTIDIIGEFKWQIKVKERTLRENKKIVVFPTYQFGHYRFDNTVMKNIKVDFFIFLDHPQNIQPITIYSSDDRDSSKITMPIRKIIDDIGLESYSYLTLMTHKNGIWLFMNKKMENNYYFVLIDCKFEQDQTSVFPTANEGFHCSKELVIAPFCKLIELNEIDLNLIYKIEYGEDIQTGLNLFYLVTNCNMTLTILSSKGFEKHPDSGSTRMMFPIQEVIDIDKNDMNAYAVVKPYNEAKVYILKYRENNKGSRLFQNNSFEADFHMFFFDEKDARPDMFLTYNRSKKGSSSFVWYRFNEEQLKTTLNNLEFVDGVTNFSLRLIGEGANRAIQTYQFDIIVIDKFNKVIQTQPFPEIWYYEDSVEEVSTITLPYDATTTYANDLIIIGDSNKNGPQCVMKLKSVDSVVESGQHIWVSDQAESKGLPMIEEIQYTLQSGSHIFFQYHNDSISVYDCKEENIDKVSEKVTPFKCRSLFFNGRSEKIIGTVPIAFRLLYSERGKYYLGLIVSNSKENKMIVTCFKIMGEKHNLFSIEAIGHFDIPFSFGKIIYYRSHFIFVGASKSRDNIPQWNLKTFKIPVDSTNMKLESIKTQDIGKTVFRFPECEVLSFISITTRQFAFVQRISPSSSLITFCYLEELDYGRVVLSMSVDNNRYTILKVTKHRIIVVDHLIGMYGFIMILDKYKQKYIGILPIHSMEDLRTHGRPASLVEISDFSGVCVFQIAYQNRIEIYSMDLRFNQEDPFMRLKHSTSMMLDPSSISNKRLILNFINHDTFKMNSLVVTHNLTRMVPYDLYGRYYELTFNRLELTKMSNIFHVSAGTKGSLKEHELRSFTYTLNPTEYDHIVHAVAKPTSLKSRRDIMEVAFKEGVALDQLVAIYSPTSGLELIEPRGKPRIAELTTSLERYATLVKDTKDTEIETDNNWSWLPDERVEADEYMRVIFNRYLLIWGPKGYRVYMIDKSGLEVKMLISRRDEERHLYNAFINYDFRMQHTSRGSGPIAIVLALYQGEYEMSDLEIHVLDTRNTSNNYSYTMRDVCKCDKMRFEIVGRNEENFTLSFHFRLRSDNGTSWITSLIDLVPDLSSPNNNSILKYFVSSELYNLYTTTFQLKLNELSSYGLMKPTMNSTMSFYFFENSGMVGLLYMGSRTIYSRHSYSTRCILRRDTFVSCFIIEQEMEIGCIVVCDETTIESFKIRLKVDDIEVGSKEELSGVNFIYSESLKIPPNYKVVKVVKGENTDFVVANLNGELYILMYDVATSQIFHVMDGRRVCPEEKPDCLASVFIHQIPGNGILIIPKGVKMGDVLWVRRRPKLIIRKEKLNLQNIEGYKLRIHGLKVWSPSRKSYIDNFKDIEFYNIFTYREESYTFLYIILGFVAFLGILSCVFLMMYKNSSSDSRSSYSQSTKKDAKTNKSVEYNSIINSKEIIGAGTSE